VDTSQVFYLDVEHKLLQGIALQYSFSFGLCPVLGVPTHLEAVRSPCMRVIDRRSTADFCPVGYFGCRQ
jgi:hypothetical protein